MEGLIFGILRYYQTLPYPETKKIKFKPRTKFNHNIYNNFFSSFALYNLQALLMYDYQVQQ